MKEFRRPDYSLFNSTTKKTYTELSLQDVQLMLGTLNAPEKLNISLFRPAWNIWKPAHEVLELQTPFEFARNVKSRPPPGLRAKPGAHPSPGMPRPAGSPSPGSQALARIGIAKVPAHLAKPGTPNGTPAQANGSAPQTRPVPQSAPAPAPAASMPTQTQTRPMPQPVPTQTRPVPQATQTQTRPISQPVQTQTRTVQIDQPVESLGSMAKKSAGAPSPTPQPNLADQLPAAASPITSRSTRDPNTCGIAVENSSFQVLAKEFSTYRAFITRVDFPYLVLTASWPDPAVTDHPITILYQGQTYNLNARIENPAHSQVIQLTESRDLNYFHDLLEIYGLLKKAV